MRMRSTRSCYAVPDERTFNFTLRIDNGVSNLTPLVFELKKPPSKNPAPVLQAADFDYLGWTPFYLADR